MEGRETDAGRGEHRVREGVKEGMDATVEGGGI